MLYKPRFCCHCGEKIERIEWRWWTNRRFCELCSTDFVGYEAGRRILVGIALFIGILGVSGLWRNEQRLPVASIQPANELTNVNKSAGNQPVLTTVGANTANPNLTATHSGNSASQAQTENTSPPQTLKTKQSAGSQIQPDDAVYFCGALTKKGTACSRRVKGGGRCWQHSGQPGALPPEKLLINK